jgi:putative endonuclease
MYYVYIIKSLNKNWHYVGSSNEPGERLKQHNAGLTKSTKHYAPFKLIYTESYNTLTECLKREKFIKKNHALKKALIPGLK